MTLPMRRIRSRASNPHHSTTITVRMDGTDLPPVEMHEATARQLLTALMGSLDWCDRQRRRNPKQHNEIRALIRSELVNILKEEPHT